MLSQDVQHDKLVEFCVTIAEHNLDFAMNHMILELLKQDSLSEVKVIGLRALLAIVMSPSSQHVGLEIFIGKSTFCRWSSTLNKFWCFGVNVITNLLLMPLF